MVALSKSDSGFNRFVTGTLKGMKQMTFVDDLKGLRTTATFEECNDGLFAVASCNRRAKQAQKRAIQEQGAPSIVNVTLPAAENFTPHVVQVQASLDVRDTVYIELRESVLDHVAACIRCSVREEHGARQVVGGGVRWDSKRNGYIARRPNKRMRTFRPEDDAEDEDIALHDAKSKALTWAAKDGDTTPERDEDEEESEQDD